jgi:hypothetical protein
VYVPSLFFVIPLLSVSLFPSSRVFIISSLLFVVSVSAIGEYYTHRLNVQYTINQKGKVFQESRKTQNQGVNLGPEAGHPARPLNCEHPSGEWLCNTICAR